MDWGWSEMTKGEHFTLFLEMENFLRNCVEQGERNSKIVVK
jgi:hypothetical protein